MDERTPPGDQPVTRTEAEGATVDLPEGLGFFSVGQVLGERYEILEMLGRGGMGESGGPSISSSGSRSG